MKLLNRYVGLQNNYMIFDIGANTPFPIVLHLFFVVKSIRVLRNQQLCCPDRMVESGTGGAHPGGGGGGVVFCCSKNLL